MSDVRTAEITKKHLPAQLADTLGNCPEEFLGFLDEEKGETPDNMFYIKAGDIEQDGTKAPFQARICYPRVMNARLCVRVSIMFKTAATGGEKRNGYPVAKVNHPKGVKARFISTLATDFEGLIRSGFFADEWIETVRDLVTINDNFPLVGPTVDPETPVFVGYLSNQVNTENGKLSANPLRLDWVTGYGFGRVDMSQQTSGVRSFASLGNMRTKPAPAPAAEPSTPVEAPAPEAAAPVDSELAAMAKDLC